MLVTPAEPVAGPPAPAAVGAPPPHAARARLRLALLALGAALVLAAMVLLAWKLAAARVPQHRAALEELIRHETGLEVGFRELSVRWGWYGPEAVFHAVVLGEPGASMQLRAPRLIVGLDLWRMARSGHLEAGRITLEKPDIDLGADAIASGAAGAPRPQARAPGDPWGLAARMLSRWRGGRIDIEDGTLRGLAPRGAPAVLTLRHVQLRRLGAEWSADARLLLPQGLGEGAHLALQMSGDPAQLQNASGTLSFEGERLELSGWRALAAYPGAARYLPRAGSGNLELRVSFAAGGVRAARGTIHAAALEWGALSVSSAPLAFEELRARWQLERHADAWQLRVDELEAGARAAPAAGTRILARLVLDAAADGSYARGRLEHAPLAGLAALARACAPQLPLEAVAIGGEARELSFDWSAARPAGARLLTAAELENFTLATPAGDVLLGGLKAHLSGSDARLLVDLASRDAQLTVAHEQPVALEGLEVAARLAVNAAEGGWQLRADDLKVQHAGASLAASAVIGARAAGATPRMSAHLALRDADVPELARLLGAHAVSTLAAATARLTSGRIESAELNWRGAAARAAPSEVRGAAFSGALVLRGASFGGDELWPDADGVDARIDWHGPRVHAVIEHGHSGSFQLASGSADWDLRGARPLHLSARVAGAAADALAWLRAHPQLLAWSEHAAAIDLRGDTLLDVDFTLPAPARPGRNPARPPRLRIAAILDGAQLHPLPGLPPIEALRGTLAFSGGRLQRSTFTGRWLGGPVSLGVSERGERGAPVLAISGRGLLDAQQALRAAGGETADALLAGNAEWSALLTLRAAPDGQAARGAHWQLRADSSLVGVTSRLPEPFAKPAGAALALQVEVQGAGDSQLLRVSLGERMRALAALTRSGDDWRIERGAVRLAATAPTLPAEPVLSLDGRLSRLDLAASLALWRQAGRDAALPELRARLAAATLLAGNARYADVAVAARVTRGGGTLQLEAAELLASAQWPASIDGEHPALVHLASFNLAQPGDAALAAGLAAALAPATELSVDDLRWQGRSLGHFSAALAFRADALDVTGARLSGAAGDTQARAHCAPAACRATFSLESDDAAATLAAFGLRPDVSAGRARLEGELQWVPQAPAALATLGGHLHMQLENGLAQAGPPAGTPFALLSVPALLAGTTGAGNAARQDGDAAARGLGFRRLTADFELHDGEASTRDLHLDGDAEILVRGRVGLAAHDYDEQALVLRGEERLPAAVRRLGPTPRVAALWLSLRQWLGGSATDRPRGALHLRGTWNEPRVTPDE